MWKHRSSILSVAILILTVSAFYSNSLTGEWHFDDFQHIKENPSIRDMGNIPRFFTDSSTFSRDPGHRMYRPLLMVTHSVDYYLAARLLGDGTDVRVYHLTNLVLHLTATILVFFTASLLFRFLAPNPSLQPVAAGLAAALAFGLHPVNAESVLYLSSRSSILSSLLCFAALFLYTKAVERSPARTAPFFLSLLLYVGAVLSKEIAIVLPAMILIFEGIRRAQDRGGQPWRVIAARTAPFAAFAAALFLLYQRMTGLDITGQLLSSGGPQATKDITSQLATQAKVWIIYMREWLVPTSLSLDKAVSVSPSFLDPKAAISLLAIGIAVFLAVRSRREAPVACLGLLWFFTALVPSSIFRLLMVHNDNRLYLPGLGAALVAAQVAQALHIRSQRGGRAWKPVVLAAAVLVPLSLGAMTFIRSTVYSDQEILWKRVLRQNPQSRLALQALSNHFLELGDLSTSSAYMKRLLAMGPATPDILVNAAALEFDLGNLSAARQYLNEASRIAPWMDRVHHNLGRVYVRLGDFSSAEKAFLMALETNPGNVEAMAELGRLYFQQRRMDQAEALLRKALALDPWGMRDNHYMLGSILEERGAIREAVAAYGQYLEGGWGDPMTRRIASQRIEELRQGQAGK